MQSKKNSYLLFWSRPTHPPLKNSKRQKKNKCWLWKKLTHPSPSCVLINANMGLWWLFVITYKDILISNVDQRPKQQIMWFFWIAYKVGWLRILHVNEGCFYQLLYSKNGKIAHVDQGNVLYLFYGHNYILDRLHMLRKTAFL